jgi:hypothetical protein
MNTNSLIPIFEEGDWVTGTATADVVGRQLVKISGDKQADGTYSFAPAGAGDVAIGIAGFSAKSGKRVTVAMIDAVDSIMPLLASAAVAAGDHLKPAAAGQVVTTTTGGDKCIAIALAGSYNDSGGTRIVEAILVRHTI